MTAEQPIRVVIVEDNASFREGLVALFSTTLHICVKGSYLSVEQALRNFPACDVLILDIHLPGMNGVEAIPVFKARFPDVSIAMFTIFNDDEHVFNAILHGASGYLLKTTPPARLIQAVEDLFAGGTPMTPEIARRVMHHFRTMAAPARDYQLSAREKEILSALVDGLDNKGIAERLFVSYETVRTHLKNIYTKMHVTSQVQAVSKAIRERVI